MARIERLGNDKPVIRRSVNGTAATVRPLGGRTGATGAPGGSDASFAAWVTDTAAQTYAVTTGKFAPAVVLTGAGIDLTGATDCTTALRAKFAAGLAAGAKRFVGVHGATYKIAIPDGETLATFTGTTGITVDMSNSTIDNSATSYTADTVTPMFLIDGATDTTVLLRRYLGFTLPTPTSHLGYRGATLVRAINASKGVTVRARIDNARYGVQTGEYGNATKGQCSGFDLHITGSMIGYPLAAYYADRIRHDIDVDGIHRAVYIAGCGDVRGVARWKDQYIADIAYLITDCLTSGTDAAAQADPIGAATTSRGCSNVDIVSIDKGSTVFAGSTSLAGITLSRVDPCKFRNIKVRGTAGSATVGVSQRTGMFKVASDANSIWSRYAFDWEPHVVLENIDIGGNIDHGSQTGEGNTAGDLFVRAYDTLTAHAATIRNLTFRDLTIKQSPGNTRACYLEAPGITDNGVHFERVSASGVRLEALTNATVPITLTKSVFGVVNLIGVTGGSRLQLIKSLVADITDTITGNSGALANITVDDSSVAGATFKGSAALKLITLALSGGSTTWSNAIPTGATIRSVAGRLLSAITGTGVTGYAVGPTGDVTKYFNQNVLAAGTSWFAAKDGTAAGGAPHLVQATTNIVVTARTAGGADGAQPFTGGSLRLVLIYDLPSAPTS